MIASSFFLTFSCFMAFFVAYLLCDYFMAQYQKKKRLSERLLSVSPGSHFVKDKVKLFHKKRSGLIEKKLQGYLSHFKSENWFQLQLYRSGLSVSLTYSVFGLVLCVIFMMYMSLSFYIANFFMSLVGSLFGVIFMTWLVLSFLKGRRQNLIIKNLPVAIDMILRSLKSGYSVEKTFIVVANEMHASIADEFKQIVQHMNVGVSYEEALRFASERVHTADFYFLVNALIIQRQTGGSLSETLENLLFLLYRRHEIRLKTLSLSAEAKTTGIILGAVPLVIWVIIMFVKPEYMDFFLYDAMGIYLLKVVVCLLISEAVIIRWLTNIKVE